MGALVDGAWVLPEQRYAGAHGRARLFRVRVTAQTASGRVRPLKPEHWDKWPAGWHAVVEKTTGVDGGKLRTSRVVVEEGRNLGRKNATTPLTQAVSEAESEWRHNRRRRQGLVTGPAAAGAVADAAVLPGVKPLIPPMLLTALNQIEPPALPWYVFVKYNGVRGLVTAVSEELLAELAHKSPPEHIAHARALGIAAYTRNGRFCNATAVIEELRPLLAARPSLFADVEFLAYDAEGRALPLQDINARVSRFRAAPELHARLLDVYDAARPDWPFRERWAAAEAWVRDGALRGERVKLAECTLAETRAAAERAHAQHVQRGEEGSVIRAADSLYHPTYNDRRSRTTLKWKPRQSAEFPCVGYSAGERGKSRGLLMWVIEVPLAGGGARRMRLDPVLPEAERRALYEQFERDPAAFDAYRGKPLTVTYSELSKEGVPLQAKGEAFREDL